MSKKQKKELVLSDKTKKILVWCLIIIVFVLVGGEFLMQFLGLEPWLEIQTLNFGKITLPSILVTGFLFWTPIFIVGGIYDWLEKKVKNKKK